MSGKSERDKGGDAARHQPRKSRPVTKVKERPASKGRVHKGKARR